MSTIIGNCARCGETVTVIDGVWPPGHGDGKCAPVMPAVSAAVKGATISLPDTAERCEAPGCLRKAEWICRGTDAGVAFVARCCEAHAIYLGEDESDETYQQERIA